MSTRLAHVAGGGASRKNSEGSGNLALGATNKKGRRIHSPLHHIKFRIGYLLAGVTQLGKKVSATILAVCPRVTLLFTLKYGLEEASHGSACAVAGLVPPHG